MDFQFRIIFLQFLDLCFQGIGNLNQVGCGLFVNGDHDTLIPIDVGETCSVRFHFFHAGNVAQVNNGTCGCGDRQILDILQGCEFTDSTDGYGCITLRQGTGRQVHIFSCQHTGNGGCGQAITRQFCRIDRYTYFTFDTTGQINGGYTFDTFQTVHNVIFQHFVEGVQIQVFRSDTQHDRHGIDIHFYYHRLIGTIGQGGLDLVQFISHIHGSHIDISTVYKLQQYHRHIGCGIGSDGIYIGNRTHTFFQRFGYQVFNFFGGRTHISCSYNGDRQVHIRHHGLVQVGVRQNTCDKHHQGHHDGGYWFSDTKFGEHLLIPPFLLFLFQIFLFLQGRHWKYLLLRRQKYMSGPLLQHRRRFSDLL